MNNEYGLIPKVYAIDYDFIIKNYTDMSLWDRQWNLLVYKDSIFKIYMSTIDCKNKQINFHVTLNTSYSNTSYCDFWSIDYSLNNMTIDFLKKQIVLKMKHCIESVEDVIISKYDTDVENARIYLHNAEEQLEEEANEYLNELGISDEKLRDLYINDFISDNQYKYDNIAFVKSSKRYHYLTDLWLCFAEMIKDDNLKEDIRGGLYES